MDLRIVSQFSTVGEAEAARSALEGAGIDVEVLDEQIVTVDWLYSNAVGGVKLLVRDGDIDEAEKILSTLAVEAADAEAEPARAAEPAEEPVHCPWCRSTDVARIPRLRFLFFFALIFLGVGTAVHQPALALAGVAVAAIVLAVVPTHRCTSCGRRWTRARPFEPVAAAPLPIVADLIERRCPRCGSPEFHRIAHRRLRAVPLLWEPAIVFVVPIWLFLPKYECDNCGFRK